LFKILIKFRSYEKVCVWDLSKAYNQILTGPEELHMRRLVWRWGKEDDQWKVYGFTHIHFGDLPAAPFLELTKKKALELGRDICPKTANQMEEGYVDDGNGGGDDDFIDQMIGEITEVDGQLYFSGTVSRILDTLSLRPKFMARSGEKDKRILAKLGGPCLGCSY
jgi:hypothetical protein